MHNSKEEYDYVYSVNIALMETSKQELLDRRYLRMATIWAENSYCVRRQVGALLVKDDMIISDGYNGTPSGFENVCEDENGLTKPYVLTGFYSLCHSLSVHGMQQVDHPVRHQEGSVP